MLTFFVFCHHWNTRVNAITLRNIYIVSQEYTHTHTHNHYNRVFVHRVYIYTFTLKHTFMHTCTCTPCIHMYVYVYSLSGCCGLVAELYLGKASGIGWLSHFPCKGDLDSVLAAGHAISALSFILIFDIFCDSFLFVLFMNSQHYLLGTYITSSLFCSWQKRNSFSCIKQCIGSLFYLHCGDVNTGHLASACIHRRPFFLLCGSFSLSCLTHTCIHVQVLKCIHKSHLSTKLSSIFPQLLLKIIIHSI